MNSLSTSWPLLESMFQHAVKACHPNQALAKYLPTNQIQGKEIVLGAGKAAIEMAAVVNQHFKGNVEGAVVTRHGQSEYLETGNIEKCYGNHPIPDESGVEAAKRIVEIAMRAKEGDRVHFLVSGGGSALFTLPKEGLSLPKVKEITDHLVKSGLPISDINCVRRHLSQVSGGRLAQIVAPAELITYSISDVVGDAPEDIASGPTVLSKNEPDRVIRLLAQTGYIVDNLTTEIIYSNPMPEKVKGDYKLIASAQGAIEAVSVELEANGWTVINLGVDLQGYASNLGKLHAEHVARRKSATGNYAFVSGGELTVRVTNSEGAGGPNLEYLAALAASMPSEINFAAIACDTDGIDGSEDNAGGFVCSDFMSSVAKKNWDVKSFLDTNRTYELFSALNSLVVTGPTGTNVNDVRIVLVKK